MAINELAKIASNFLSVCKQSQRQLELLSNIEQLQAMGVRKDQIDSFYEYTTTATYEFSSTIKYLLDFMKYLKVAAQIQEIEFNAETAFDNAVQELKEYFAAYRRIYQ